MENDKAVFVVETSKDDPEQDVARQRIVKMGDIKGANVQILSGLREGDRLILPGGNRYVSDGQKVSVKGDATSQPATQTK
jgi:multidrug efflux pump subunit AcrA (membrane-fusion protein)